LTADESLLNTLTPCPGYVQKLEAWIMSYSLNW
jgi:hypothetical protein